MPDIYSITAKHRKAVLAGDRYSSQRVLLDYAKAKDTLLEKLYTLANALDGRPVKAVDLVRLQQYKDLFVSLDTAEKQIRVNLEEIVNQGQSFAVRSAERVVAEQLQHYQELYGEQFVPFIAPAPTAALNALIGQTVEGSPVRDVIAGAGKRSVTRTLNVIRDGLVAGHDPKRLAKAVQSEWGAGAVRAMALVRTETMRAYRQGTIEGYQANKDVVLKYEWLCDKSVRTCAACLALDGQTFALGQAPRNHVNCRCTVIPVLRGDPKRVRETGAEWFDNLTDANKLKVVGKRGLEAVKAGAKLTDFVQVRKDKTWGDQAVQRLPVSFLPAPKAPPTPKTAKVVGDLDANGRFVHAADAIDYAKSEFDLWNGRNAKTPGRVAEWLKTLGAGKTPPVDQNLFLGNLHGEKVDAGLKKLAAGLKTLPNLAPSVYDHLRANPFNAYSGKQVKKDNAFYRRATKTVYLSSIGNDAAVWVHEMTHHIEYELGLAGRHIEWVLGRATGPETKLSILTGQKVYDTRGYGPEMAYPDTFVRAYVGKVYRVGQPDAATEVLTMGTQSIVEAPEAFFASHPDHFWLTMAALLGK